MVIDHQTMSLFSSLVLCSLSTSSYLKYISSLKYFLMYPSDALLPEVKVRNALGDIHLLASFSRLHFTLPHLKIFKDCLNMLFYPNNPGIFLHYSQTI